MFLAFCEHFFLSFFNNSVDLLIDFSAHWIWEITWCNCVLKVTGRSTYMKCVVGVEEWKKLCSVAVNLSSKWKSCVIFPGTLCMEACFLGPITPQHKIQKLSRFVNDMGWMSGRLSFSSPLVSLFFIPLHWHLLTPFPSVSPPLSVSFWPRAALCCDNTGLILNCVCVFVCFVLLPVES